MDTKQDPHSDQLIGVVLGPYTILEEIGRGNSNGTVYKAQRQPENHMVALKVLPSQFTDDPGSRMRFERDMEIFSRLEHPHIVPISDYGVSQRWRYVAMPYLGGGSLKERIQQGPIPLESLLKPFQQVASALDYVHQQAIIHRDIEPGNIMLDEARNAYLNDFGLAQIGVQPIGAGSMVGNPIYMSPEQVSGIALDNRSDIYALGIVLFEMVTGHVPFEAESPMGVLLRHITESVPSARELRPDIPPMVDEVIAKATAKLPDDRYRSANEMAGALKEALSA